AVKARKNNVMSYCPVLKLSKTLGFANAPKLMNMNLTAYIMKFEIECPDMVKVFMKQLSAGLAHIHDQRGMHRNIKASNILVDTDSTPHRVKIADFGSAKILLNLNLSPLVGTGAYKAPELLLGVVDYGTPADIWALGCIFGEMANWNCLPIFVKNDRAEEVLLDTFPTLGEVGVDLLSRMLCLNPGNRITAVEALNHPYFSSGGYFYSFELGICDSAIDIILTVFRGCCASILVNRITAEVARIIHISTGVNLALASSHAYCLNLGIESLQKQL
ncbi:hypothetical protein IFM89_027367, partial [Coptis chinensis]